MPRLTRKVIAELYLKISAPFSSDETPPCGAQWLDAICSQINAAAIARRSMGRAGVCAMPSL